MSRLHEERRVLDKGFIRCVDVMGDDAAVVQAARVSYGEGTKTPSSDRDLIRYLMRHRHTTPFEMCEAKFHVRVPMDTWRQWIRHRTASVNEYSTRYSLAIDAAQTTDIDEWRLQNPANKQGSAGTLADGPGSRLSTREAELHAHARQVYQERIELGVAREQARKDLPLSTYTEAYWKIDLHNLLHFLELRLDSRAQEEIRRYAEAIAEVVAEWVPTTWEAFRDYRFGAETLPRTVVELVRLANWPSQALAYAETQGWLNPANRERREVEDLLARLGLAVPWETGS